MSGSLIIPVVVPVIIIPVIIPVIIVVVIVVIIPVIQRFCIAVQDFAGGGIDFIIVFVLGSIEVDFIDISAVIPIQLRFCKRCCSCTDTRVI